MIRLTRDLYVAEEKILSAEVHNTTVLVQFNDGTPAGRTVEVPPFKDRDAAERWVNIGFSDRPESDFEDSAPTPTVGQPTDAPVSVGHPITAEQVKEHDETVGDEDAQKIAAAAGVPAGMMPALTPELAEIRERELKEISDQEAEADRVVAEERITYPAVVEPQTPAGLVPAAFDGVDKGDLSSTGDGIVEDRVGPSAATIAPVSASDPDGSTFNAELAELAADDDEDNDDDFVAADGEPFAVGSPAPGVDAPPVGADPVDHDEPVAYGDSPVREGSDPAQSTPTVSEPVVTPDEVVPADRRDDVAPNETV